MDTETLTTPLEVPISRELAFADVEAVEQLRRAQYAMMDEASNATAKAFDPDAAEVFRTSRENAMKSFDAMCEAYLNQNMSRDSNPERYDLLAALLKTVSVHNMGGSQGDTKWYLGDQDDDGEYKTETSGISLVRSTLQALSNEDEPSDDAPEIMNAEDRATALQSLKVSRTELAKLSIERRRKLSKSGRKAKSLEDKFNTEQEKYQALCLQLGVDDALKLRSEGASEEDIRTAVVTKTILERKAFTEAELSVLEHDDSRRGRFARFLAKRNNLIGFNLIGGALAGFGITYGLKQVTKGAAVAVGVGVAAPVAIGIGLAARTTRSVLNATINNRVSQHRLFDTRAEQDLHDLNTKLEPVLSADHTDDKNLVGAVNSHLQDNIRQRTEKDRISNVKRVALAAAIGGAGAVAGAVAAEHVNFSGHSHRSHPLTKPHHGPKTGSKPSGKGGKPIPPPTPPVTAPVAPNGLPHSSGGTIDGFQTSITVPHASGYDMALQQLAAEKGIHLSGAQSWDAYQTVAAQNHGHFFLNDPSYLRSQGDYGISRPGQVQWDPKTISDFNAWLENHNLTPAA